ncbi:MAG: NAD(P)H-hydrate dehydratase [Burkholderiales bacterium]|nr:NAD(P)H-hydrate dehydratase [Burkholderiales bacterium]
MSAPISALFPTDSLRRLEAAALAGLPPGTLMARAAGAVAGATARLARSLAPGRPVLALVGPGNNGGDALLALALLRERGYACSAVASSSGPPSRGDAAEAWRAAQAAGVPIDTPEALDARLAAAPIVIDGLFGIGLDRPLAGQARRFCEAVAQAALPVVAVDVPSGLDADTGAIVGGTAGCALSARLTVTMIADKPGLHTGAALDRVGTVEVATLGLEAARETFVQRAGSSIGQLFDAAGAAALLAPRARDSNKGSFGSVLAYGGARGMRGAALLAGRGAQALGAGKVFVAAPDGEPFDPGQPQLMTAPAEPDFGACDAVAIGCGLGRSGAARRQLAAALASARALVLDADALNLLAADASLLAAPPAAAPQRCVMTPHPLEAARLLGCEAAQVQADRRGAAVALAQRYRMVALLKGAGSVVAEPGGAWWIVGAGSPALASAGTGDVLAGMIAALLARGLDAAPAACLAAWLHGCAGMRFETAHGHAEGLSAAELPRWVRVALHRAPERGVTANER